MSDVSDLRQRLAAIAQTRQITNAMYLMSSTRMRRESQRVKYAREYYNRLRSAVLDIRDNARGITHGIICIDMDVVRLDQTGFFVIKCFSYFFFCHNTNWKLYRTVNYPLVPSF